MLSCVSYAWEPVFFNFIFTLYVGSLIHSCSIWSRLITIELYEYIYFYMIYISDFINSLRDGVLDTVNVSTEKSTVTQQSCQHSFLSIRYSMFLPQSHPNPNPEPHSNPNFKSDLKLPRVPTGTKSPHNNSLFPTSVPTNIATPETHTHTHIFMSGPKSWGKGFLESTSKLF